MIKKEICDTEILILLNRKMYEKKYITEEKYNKVNNILVKKIYDLRDQLDESFELTEAYKII